MTELTNILTMKEVSFIGFLVLAIYFLSKEFLKMSEMQEAQRDKREEWLLSEIEENKIERKQEREEWLAALDKNTLQLQNVADKLEVIPKLQNDVDSMKEDLKDIRKNLGA